ncbi:MAG: metal ABC transporter permease [Atopobium sp.]|uniref:metal ABC transporter permease n=1 Tax=Atopobium sp. TaxID=1872650 RepID=UPI002A7532B1|nr:metal ABC transporter permease [Atopobium sp.]MDY2789003.1 metal ABC transporter permease [Atopobium sp.]MDY4522027.1 metal ABC transporter permease [Atopobium sp.]
MFEYEFMQRAFVVGTILAVILPCIGLPILLKRLSMMGDTLSHASLAGVAVGLCFGFNPLLGSVVACIVAGLSIEVLSSKLKSYQEISTVIVLAASIGLAGIFTSLAGNSNSISSYLFGSIVTIGDLEFYLVITVAVVVIVTYKLLYNRLYLSVFDIQSAPLLGINTKLLSFVFSFLVAITISIAAKTIGSLIVSSLLVVPVISAMQFSKTYRSTLGISMLLSIGAVYAGLCISYYYNLRPGAVIVLLSVGILIVSLAFKRK